jgi:peroxiredoxin
MNIRQTLTALCLFLSSLIGLPQAFAETASVGKPAPGFSLQNALGQSVNLSQFSGKVVVLEWFNPECPFVKKFYTNRDMQRFQKEARDKGVAWLTINSSADGKQGNIPQGEAASFAKEQGLDPASLLLDPEGAVGRSFGARTTPHMYVIDQKGLLAYAGAIDSTPSTRSSDIASSTNFVTQTVDALQQGRNPSPASTDPYGCSVKYR